MTRPLPRRLAPPLKVRSAFGGHWDLRDQTPDAFTLIVFYRHRYCSLCKAYLQELDKYYDGFQAIGVEPIAISTNSRLYAEATFYEWELKQVPIGYDLSFDTAREWGLYCSGGRHETDPTMFTEPALYLINKDGVVHYASTQSMPFGRPDLGEMLNWCRKLIEKKIPPRGEMYKQVELESAVS